MTIGRKVTLGFVLVIVLLCAITAVNLAEMSSVTATYDDITSRIDKVVAEAHHLDAGVQSQGRIVLGFIATRDASYKGDFEKALSEVSATLARLDQMIESAENTALLDQIKQAQESYLRVARPVFDRPNMAPEETTAILAQLKATREGLTAKTAEMAGVAASLATKSAADAQAVAESARNFSLIVSALSVLLAVSIAVWITLGVKRPIAALHAQVKDLAEGGGDLTRKLEAHSRDEIGDLVVTFNAFLEFLRTLLLQVRESSLTVATSAEQLSSTTAQVAATSESIAESAGQLATGATRQAEAVHASGRVVAELRQAIDQIASGAQDQAQSAQKMAAVVSGMVGAIADVADRASSVAASSQQAAGQARNGAEVVDRTVSGMAQVRSTVLTSAERIRELSRLSAQIGQITETITEIADQTNLLALNAAIEAARAGEHGRGFAVVADEVRKLAERAGRSASEIANLIQRIQGSTAQAVSVMEQGTVQVEEGSRLAADAGHVLKEIVRTMEETARDIVSIRGGAESVAASSRAAAEIVDSVAAITQENTAATEQMAAGSEEVNKSISDIRIISEQNGQEVEVVASAVEEMNASSEEMAASARVLNDTARELLAKVSRFKL